MEILVIFTGKNFRTNLWLGRYRTSLRLFRWWNGINVPSYKIMIHFWNWLGFNLWNINFETGMIGQKRFQIPNITIQVLKWCWKSCQCSFGGHKLKGSSDDYLFYFWSKCRKKADPTCNESEIEWRISGSAQNSLKIQIQSRYISDPFPSDINFEGS